MDQFGNRGCETCVLEIGRDFSRLQICPRVSGTFYYEYHYVLIRPTSSRIWHDREDIIKAYRQDAAVTLDPFVPQETALIFFLPVFYLWIWQSCDGDQERPLGSHQGR